MADFATCRDELTLLLKARIPFISLATDERDRALELLSVVASAINHPIHVHKLSEGTREIVSGRIIDEDLTVHGALDFATPKLTKTQQFTFVLTEAPDLTDETAFSRQVLDVVTSAVDMGGTVVVITSAPVWSKLQRRGMSLSLDLPHEEEMIDIISSTLADNAGGFRCEWDEDDTGTAARMLSGVSRIEAQNAIFTIIAGGSVLKTDLEKLATVKDRMFSDISGLERIEWRDEPTVGGLAGLREWLEVRRADLTADLAARNLRPPRGVLLVGVPGCGKSLSAKSVAAAWKLPLYRLDLANIHGMYVGQSESRLKEALSTADRVAPCVLWIDEIEKGLSGASGSSDGGVSTRLVGHFLYWLQEGRARVFVVATANDITKLPSELFRRGRFDEIFFVDLPDEAERREIISLYVGRYRLAEPSPSLLNELVQMTDGFAGSDLDAVLADLARADARTRDDAEAKAQVSSEAFWREAFAKTRPLSRTNPDQIESIRSWGRERARPASGEFSERGEASPKVRRSVLL